MNSLQQSPRKRHWKLPTAVGVGALLAGVGIGTTGQPEPEIVTETETVTEVEEVEVETIVEKEVEVEVEVTPDACVIALEEAQDLFETMLQVNLHYLDAVDYAGMSNYSAATLSLESGTDLTTEATERFEADYSPQALLCMEGAK